MSMAVREILGRLRNVQGNPPQWEACCPAHKDDSPSLSIKETQDGKVLLYCHAGCAYDDVLRALDMTPSDLSTNTPQHDTSDVLYWDGRTILDRYIYQDEDGVPLFRVVRLRDKDGGKDFRQQAREGGTWQRTLGEARRVLYHLPQLRAADPSEPVFIVEGEKDVISLEALGLVATTSPMGAGKWRTCCRKGMGRFEDPLRGRNVIIVPDNDEVGRDHADTVYESLLPIAAHVDILTLPGLDEHGDVSDWIQAGGTREQLLELVADLRRIERPRALIPTRPTTNGNAPARPVVQIEGGRLPRIVDEVEEILLNSDGCAIYQQGGRMLVRVVRMGGRPNRKGYRRDPGALAILPVELAWLISRLTESVDFQVYNKRDKEWRSTNCPQQVAATYMARAGHWRVPVLKGVIEAPTLREDGSILEAEGYDTASGLYLDTDGETFAPIPDRPTKDDAVQSVATLVDLLGEFPFVTPSDLSAAISMLMTALVRRSLPSAPGAVISAPVMRSGKSMLADVISMTATGRTCSVLAQAENRAEEAKRLLAILIEGDPVICFDNLEAPFGSDVIAQLLTQPTIKGRILRETRTAVAPTTCTVLATGNNVEVRGDTSVRVLRIDLDPEMEHPERREFARNLHTHVLDHRSEIVLAALTILRAYHVADRPGQGLHPWAGFDAWSNWIRSALVWLGLDDPCTTRERIEDEDPVRRDLGSLLQAWDAIYGDTKVEVPELVRLTEREEATGAESDLVDALLAVAGSRQGLNPRALGRYLGKYKGRLEGGLRLVAAGQRQRRTIWRVERQR